LHDATGAKIDDKWKYDDDAKRVIDPVYPKMFRTANPWHV